MVHRVRVQQLEWEGQKGLQLLVQREHDDSVEDGSSFKFN